MARLTDKGMSGIVGNIVTYTMNGKQYIRSKPLQSKKRKKNPVNIAFGKISKNSSPMIKMIGMLNYLPFAFKLGTYNRIRSWIGNVYKENPVDFPLTVKASQPGNLNPAVDIRDILCFNIQVTDQDGIIKVLIPEFNPVRDIHSPLHTSQIKMQIIAVTSPYDEPCAKRVAYRAVEFGNISMALPANEIELIPEGPGKSSGDMAMVIIALEFATSQNKYIDLLKWQPAACIAIGRLQ